MSTKHIWVSFAPIDPLNPDVGYHIRIEDRTGTLIFTSKDPVTGKDLLTPGDCINVIKMYC